MVIPFALSLLSFLRNVIHLRSPTTRGLSALPSKSQTNQDVRGAVGEAAIAVGTLNCQQHEEDEGEGRGGAE